MGRKRGMRGRRRRQRGVAVVVDKMLLFGDQGRGWRRRLWKWRRKRSQGF